MTTKNASMKGGPFSTQLDSCQKVVSPMGNVVCALVIV